MKLALVLLGAIGALALSSCASIMNGKTSTVEIVSTPPGAAFVGNHTGVTGVTPASVDLPNGEPITVTFTLDGYAETTVVAKPRMSGWIAGNLIFGGIIGIIIDAAGSRAYVHKDMNVTMLPDGYVEPVEDIEVAEKPTQTQNWSRKPDDE